MMRSLYSGVAGLKTHQTRMDVIGNNIANVNTTAYKSSSMTFSELMSQTTQKASGANATTGVGGTNAKQIGLGVKAGAINTAITTQGSAQSTGNPFDIMITGAPVDCQNVAKTQNEMKNTAGFIFALVAAIVMMTGCRKSNSNTGKTLELIIYFESSDVSSCKEELHKWLGDKYEILSEEYKTDEKQADEFRDKYDLNENMFNIETGKVTICTLLLDNIKDETEAEKIKQGMGEVKNVGLVKMSYPYEKQDEPVIITEESEEILKYKDEIVLSFYYEADNEEQCENGIVASIKDKYSVEEVGYTNFSEDIKKYKEQNPDEVVVVPQKNIFICKIRIKNIKNESEIKTIVAEIEKDEKVSQVEYIRPTYH